MSAYRKPRAAVLIVAAAAGLSGCGAMESGTPEGEPREVVAVFVKDGKVKGVGIGSWPADVRRVFGPPSDTNGYFPVNEKRPTGPAWIQVGRDHVYRYDDFAFVFGSKVLSLMTTAPGAQTERGVGVGDPLSAIRKAYPDAACGEYDYGDGGYGFPWCRTQVGSHDVFFGDDPVRSITVTVANLTGPHPSDA